MHVRSTATCVSASEAAGAGAGAIPIACITGAEVLVRSRTAPAICIRVYYAIETYLCTNLGYSSSLYSVIVGTLH